MKTFTLFCLEGWLDWRCLCKWWYGMPWKACVSCLVWLTKFCVLLALNVWLLFKWDDASCLEPCKPWRSVECNMEDWEKWICDIDGHNLVQVEWCTLLGITVPWESVRSVPESSGRLITEMMDGCYILVGNCWRYAWCFSMWCSTLMMTSMG
ncbi:hypothetical protein NE237_027826 [Protea cynaroides]|uniref:Uncharacterized protein n=1 Tax=Protea cynaroides TaxID=273540 RepID=A0A9Q0GSM5_9MAGN|nr:hypothetical protein NE237_027826 [Protea cynaroides]